MEPPTYVFSITPMQPRSDFVPDCSKHGRWMPPKAYGNNVRKSSARTFHFNPREPNGNFTTCLAALPSSALAHKTYSIYLDRAIFWTVDYNALTEQIGDGREPNLSPYPSAASSDFGGPEEQVEYNDSWAPLKFEHRENQVSYVSRRQENLRLCVWRSDQQWATKLLPDTCSALAKDKTTDRSRGGLVGELPLLIGLMAFAIPENQLVAGLCQSMRTQWVTPPYERAAGWDDRRGMVVETYAYPPYSEHLDLVAYEQGERGIILP